MTCLCVSLRDTSQICFLSPRDNPRVIFRRCIFEIAGIRSRLNNYSRNRRDWVWGRRKDKLEGWCRAIEMSATVRRAIRESRNFCTLKYSLWTIREKRRKKIKNKEPENIRDISRTKFNYTRRELRIVQSGLVPNADPCEMCNCCDVRRKVLRPGQRAPSIVKWKIARKRHVANFQQ